MKKIVQSILLYSTVCLCYNQCTLYPLDAKACIEKTTTSCMFDVFENKCRETDLKGIETGCLQNMNKVACLNQLKNQNEEFQCYFDIRCSQATQIQLSKMGCSQKFSKYACLNVKNTPCGWDNECKQIDYQQSNQSSCEQVYQISSNSHSCAILQELSCINTGSNGDYRCITVNQNDLQNLDCTQMGLTLNACIQISKNGQKCIFQNSKCQNTELSEVISCDEKLNKEACLSISNPKLLCQWNGKACQNYDQNQLSNDQIENVNISVCLFQKGNFRFDENEKFCYKVESQDIINMPCNTKGLSKDGCLSIKQQNCVFEDVCKELSEQELKVYFCEAQLNESACINIKTEFQYCIWNGKKCERLFINQDQDCPIEFEDKEIKVNGNVCQAISKSKVSCKYNEKTHLCMLAQSNDICETPFINKTGCLSINLNNQTCQWTSQGCKFIKIIQYQTTCNSLGFANSIACSQVYENKKIGCYFNKNKEQCDSLLIEIDEQANQQIKEQNINDLRILNTINCIDQQFGLNRIACASITLEGKACLWRQDQCIYIEKASDIQNIPCLHLQFANSQVCAQASFQQEPCRYFLQEKGCVNSIINNMKCDQPGLNKFSCSLATGSCYYNYQQKKCLTVSTDINKIPNPLGILRCELDSPTQLLCLAIITPGELCLWNKRLDQCSNINIQSLINRSCNDFTNVNRNVCSQITSEYPDDKNKGYCQYDSEKNSCSIKTEYCTTKCCTENGAIGINPHSCSKYSSQEEGDYCYFINNRCRELTNNECDISDLSAVKIYINSQKFDCHQLNKSLCPLLDSNPSKRCFYLGSACLNFKPANNFNFEVLTVFPALTNKYVCYSIEASLQDKNKFKYFDYDEANQRCKIVQYPQDFSFNTCEQAVGNRNICLRYTSKNYCKWDAIKLKCVTIQEDELVEITSCNQNQNLKACIYNSRLACYFSYDFDQCLESPKNVNCAYFNKAGPVTELVCKQITKPGQLCQFQDNKCISPKKIPSYCDIYGANITSCLKNTSIECRWDQNSSECYNNKTDISELGCLDNLNIIMCPKITKEACFWNEDVSQCQIFTSISSQQFQQLNSNNSYNLKSCLLVHGAGYYYDKNTNKCVQLSNNNYKCDQYQMNEYACLYLTKTNRCYYDQNQDPLKQNKCKTFIAEQTICNSSFLINIDVCMDIPKSCIFNLANLRCQSYEVEDTTTCSFLNSLQNKGQFPNKLACSSINPDIKEPYGNQQCYTDKTTGQQCMYERFCFFANYGCHIFQFLLFYFDQQNYSKTKIKMCSFSERIEFREDVQECSSVVSEMNSIKIVQDGIKLTPIYDTTFQNCNTGSKNEYQKTDSSWSIDNKFVRPQRFNEDCKTPCGIKGQQTLNCITDSDCNSQFFQNYYRNYIQDQNCWIKKCVYHQNLCSQNNECQNYPQYNYSKNQTEDTSGSCQSYYCSGENDCYCEQTKQKCRTYNDCPKYIPEWYNNYINKKICKEIETFEHKPWCITKVLNIIDCFPIYSMALCLTNSKCFFDINQGGCMQLENNQHKVPKCTSMINTCRASASIKAICQASEIIEQPGPMCYSVQISQTICKELQSYVRPFPCSSIKKEDAQPILCALAMDNCRFNQQICVSDLDKGKCNCDNSYSRSLCLKCNCFYDYSGFCQQVKLPPQYNQTNKYYLCEEVNLLPTSNKQQICGSVEQACKYGIKCEDATHNTCDDLLGFTVSQKACTNCKSFATRYDQSIQQCLAVDGKTFFKNCENLNELACLQNTSGVMCSWKDFKCTLIESKKKQIDPTNCNLLNQQACSLEQINLCWFDQDKKQCQEYDPFKGKCNQLLNKNLCDLSMMEACKWNNNNCEKLEQIPSKVCSGLNKYACLNQVNISCGWSDERQICETVQLHYISNNNCEKFLSYNQYNLIKFNSFTCTKINIKKNCLLDKYYQCREAIITDILFCDSPGLNSEACLQRTQGKCKFDGFCQYTNEQNLGCQTNLNKYACISQTSTCKFINSCLNYPVKQYTDIISKDINFPYSISVCSVLDDLEKFSTSFIYSQQLGKCLDISNKSPYINNCQFIGINRNSCLSKTTVFCEFSQKECKAVSQIKLRAKECIENLNWFACVNMDIPCKFVNYKCVPQNEIESCVGLQEEGSMVKSDVCSKTVDVPCGYDDKTKRCMVLKSQNQCTALGINKDGCIFNTKGSFCKYENKKCIVSYDDSRCNELINYDKCLGIRRQDQNCQFKLNIGCQNLDETIIDITKCMNIETNSPTCSKALDNPCYYNLATKQCQIYENPTNVVPKSKGWSNSLSFNVKTCQIYKVNFMKTYWNNICKEVSSMQLFTLKCTSLLNFFSCVNLRTPFENCKYINNQCIEIDLNTYEPENCSSIINVNNGILCSMAKDVACKYDQNTFKCVPVGGNENTFCVTTRPEYVGYNRLACSRNPQCVFVDQCFKFVEGNYYFCEQIDQFSNCKLVQLEGCYELNNQCISISKSLSQTLQCNSVMNPMGCVQLQTQGQYCRYIQNQCIQENLYNYKKKKCSEISQINSPQFCEKTVDEPCFYNYETHSCNAKIDQFQDFECIRGLNKMACLQNTYQDFQCSFFYYCYGPNDLILNCNQDSINCCTLAKTMEQCLFQTQFNCLWQNNQCYEYLEQLDNIDCNSLTNVSRSVCYSLIDKFCIFDINNLKCQEITPNTCNNVQNPNQCSRIETIPCYWDFKEQECRIKFKSLSDTCQDIAQMYGNQRACIDVEREGEYCQFIDFTCSTFTEDKVNNNCIEQINKNSCLKQTQSLCYWKEDVLNFQSEDNSNTSVQIGFCELFKSQESSNCEPNLSYLSCLNITTNIIYCQWKDQKCQSFTDYNSLNTQIISQINCNTCNLITNGNSIIFDPQFFRCITVNDHKILQCNPPLPGTNIDACLKVQYQECKWDNTHKICTIFELIQQEKPSRQINKTSSCNIIYANQKACQMLQLQESCGAYDQGCQQVDLQSIKCNHSGLNQFACLNLISQPCRWVEDQDNGESYCEEFIPFDFCLRQPNLVNDVVCSLVGNNDPCVYNEITNQCQAPLDYYSNCQVRGINLYACIQIDNCLFMNGQCITYTPSMKLECHAAKNANYKVCSQIMDKGCKYSQISQGCMNSSSFDSCDTLGFNKKGCLQSFGCEWTYKGCECSEYLELIKPCNQITDSNKCKNDDQCTFLVFQPNQSKQIPDSTQGRCIQKTCDQFDSNQCDNKIIHKQKCYLNLQGECLSATECKQIQNSKLHCSQFVFQNLPCINIGEKYCGNFISCESILKKEECLLYQDYCFFTTACISYTCKDYKTEDKCLHKQCSWNQIQIKKQHQCIDQIPCDLITSENTCNQNFYQNKKCTWLSSLSECSYQTCKDLTDICEGKQISQYVCVQLNDNSCVQCEEIKDYCICLNKSYYCKYNYQTNKCQSLSCQSYTKENCPPERCQFDSNNKICLPQCQFHFNKYQCEQKESSCKFSNQQCQQIETKPQEEEEIIIKRIPNQTLIILQPILFWILIIQ